MSHCIFHDYEEFERFYAPPYDAARGNLEVKRLPQEAYDRIVFGITTVLYRCLKCGKPKTVQILGKKQ